MARPKLFIDASVFIAAAASPTGGSAAVLQLGSRGLVRLYCSRLVLLESTRNIREKLAPAALVRFYQQLGNLEIRLVRPPSERELEAARQIVVDKDAHVVAAAAKGHADVLLTLDRKHLLSDAVRKSRSVRIQTPGEFLRDFAESRVD